MYIKPVHISQISSLLESSDDVFFSRDWLAIYESDSRFQIHAVFNKNDEVIGGFYTYDYKRMKLLNQLAAPPFSPYNWICIKTDTSNPAKVNSFYKKLFSIIENYVTSLKKDIISLSVSPDFVDMQPFVWANYKVSNQYTYKIDVIASLESILENMSPERRKNIRKAENENIEIDSNPEKQVVFDLIYNTFKKQSKKVDENYLKRIIFDFAKETNSMIFLAKDQEGNPLACTFHIYDMKNSYYLFGGYDEHNKHEGAGALCMWNAIKKTKELGVSNFDFEGSMLQNVEKYFRGFGGEIIPYSILSKAKLPYEMLLKLKERNRF